jgi:hypothetical protein
LILDVKNCYLLNFVLELFVIIFSSVRYDRNEDEVESSLKRERAREAGASGTRSIPSRSLGWREDEDTVWTLERPGCIPTRIVGIRTK